MKTIYFRRKRQGKTDYKQRLALLKSGKPRLVVRKTLNNIIIQIVEYSPKGDLIKTSFSSIKLKKLGWNYNTKNIPAAYLAGYLCGKNYKGKEVILDAGLRKPTKLSKIYAALQGVIDAGVKVQGVEIAFEDKNKLFGKTIEHYSSLASEKMFSNYKKHGKIDMPNSIEKIKGGY